MKKKLKLSGRLKVKSFTAVMDKTEQKTTKGGFLARGSQFGTRNPWTEIKSGKGSSLRVVNDNLLANGQANNKEV